jgi:hypothetical protein
MSNDNDLWGLWRMDAANKQSQFSNRQAEDRIKKAECEFSDLSHPSSVLGSRTKREKLPGAFTG